VREGDQVDAGISVILTPGHTRGCISLVVDQPNGSIAVCGDALPNAATALAGCPYLVFWDEEDARMSARKILDAAQILYPGHDRPFRIADGKVSYISAPSRITVTAGLDPMGLPVSVTLTPGAPRAMQVEGLALERRAARQAKT